MVLRVDVVDAALEAAYGDGDRPRIVLLAPAGRLLDDALATELAAEPHAGAALRPLRGLRRARPRPPRRRRGLDRPLRARRRRAGGDGRRRRGDPQAARARSGTRESAVEESFSEALEGAPEYPHYTRPADLPRLGGARGPALRRPRAGARVARCAAERAERRHADGGAPTATIPQPRGPPHCAVARGFFSRDP